MPWSFAGEEFAGEEEEEVAGEEEGETMRGWEELTGEEGGGAHRRGGRRR